MTKELLLGLIAIVTLFVGILAAAQVQPSAVASAPAKVHRVVFEITTDGEEDWTALLNNVENLRIAFGAESTRVEIVGHGKGLGLLLPTNQGQQERMRKLHDGGVVFAACENTMRKKKVTKEQLLPFAITVDSGVAEVVRKQEEGWAYIKGGV